MFCSEETFEKYSLFGPFEYQLKQHALNQTDSNFDVIPFVDLCKHDTHWYNDLISHMYEKDKKLQPNIKHKKPLHLDIPHYRETNPTTIHPTTSRREEQNIPPAKPENQIKSSVVNYCPKSPELMQPSPSFEMQANSTTPTTSLPTTSATVRPAARELITHDYMDSTHAPANANSFKKPNQQKNLQQKNHQKSINYPWSHDTKAVNIMKNWYPLRFKLAYPRKSLLNTYEQKEFLQLYSKFRNRTHVTEKEVKHYKTYSHLKNMAIKERDAFLDYSKKYYENAEEDYEFVNPAITQYVYEMVKCLENSPLSYDRYFTKLEEFTLKQLESHQKANFVLKEKLVALGNIPKVIVPSISQNSQPNLTVSYDQISNRAPIGEFDGKSLSKISIADDKNAEKLALKYKANLILTNSSFVNLVYFLSAENRDDLKMPITIKELQQPNGDVQKVVFIDKPFIEKALSNREKNEKFFKRSLMVSFIRKSTINRQRNSFKAKQTADMDSKDRPISDIDHQIHREIKKNDVDHNEISKFESFGVVETKLIEPTESTTIYDSLKRTHDSQSIDIPDQNKRLKLEQIESTCDLVNKITEQLKQTEDVKPIKEAETNIDSSDYEDYNDELVIATDNKDENEVEKELSGPSSPTENCQKTITTPSSPPMIQSEVKESLQKSNIQEPESASEPKNVLPDLQPKVIPLIRNDEIKPTTSKEEEKEDSRTLSLSDLLSKMEEKLNSATAAVMNNPAQHMLSTLTPSLNENKHSAEKSKDFLNIDNKHGNVSYHLWESNALRFILRLSVDGYINTESSSLNSIVLYPKLEYQPQFGGEKLSHKDYCRMWAKSFIRNNCDVMLCRINVFMNKLISTSNLTHMEILSGYTNFNPQLTLNLMNSLLGKLTSLPQDHYLLSKDSNENKFSIMKSGRSQGSFDLHYFYNQLEKSDKRTSWLPVDPEIYFPYHHQLSRVPCLFEPDQKNKNSPNKNNKKGKKPNKKPPPVKSNAKL